MYRSTCSSLLWVTILFTLAFVQAACIASEDPDRPGLWGGFALVGPGLDTGGFSLTYATTSLTLQAAAGSDGFYQGIAMHRVGRGAGSWMGPDVAVFAGIGRGDELTDGDSKVGFGVVFGAVTPAHIRERNMAIRYFYTLAGVDSFFGVTMDFFGPHD